MALATVVLLSIIVVLSALVPSIEAVSTKEPSAQCLTFWNSTVNATNARQDLLWNPRAPSMLAHVSNANAMMMRQNGEVVSGSASARSSSSSSSSSCSQRNSSSSMVYIGLAAEGFAPIDDTNSYLQLRSVCDGTKPLWSLVCPPNLSNYSTLFIDQYSGTTVMQCGINSTADAIFGVAADGQVLWTREGFECSLMFALAEDRFVRMSCSDDSHVDIMRIADGAIITSLNTTGLAPFCTAPGVLVAQLGRNLLQPSAGTMFWIHCLGNAKSYWFAMDSNGNVFNTLDDSVLMPVPGADYSADLIDFAVGGGLYRGWPYSAICLMSPSAANTTCDTCIQWPFGDRKTDNGVATGTGFLGIPNSADMYPIPAGPTTPLAFFIPDAHFNMSLGELKRKQTEEVNKDSESSPSWCPAAAAWCQDYSTFFSTVIPPSMGFVSFEVITTGETLLNSVWNKNAWIMLGSDSTSHPNSSAQVLMAIDPISGNVLRYYPLGFPSVPESGPMYGCWIMDHDAASLSTVIACDTQVMYVTWEDAGWHSWNHNTLENLITLE